VGQRTGGISSRSEGQIDGLLQLGTAGRWKQQLSLELILEDGQLRNSGGEQYWRQVAKWGKGAVQRLRVTPEDLEQLLVALPLHIRIRLRSGRKVRMPQIHLG